MAEHDRSDERESRGEGAPPSLPETVRRERAGEEAADDATGGSLASTERRTRAAGHDDAASLPGTEDRERRAEEDVDAEQARSDHPSVPGTEWQARHERDD